MNKQEKELLWIWLTLKAGICSTLPSRLVSAYNNDIEKIYKTEDYSIKLTPKQNRDLCDKELDYAKEIVEWCNSNNVKILCYDNPMYPQKLASLPDAPMVLYYIGDLYDIDNLFSLACVGTRTMTKYGHDTAYSFCHDLAKSGAVVVSGMAAGIDTACHRGTLDAGGRTIAVLGCRINKVYPSENRDIMKEIARKGLLLTEYHPFYHTKPANFAQRNRIISGLCEGTIVFEADIGSGSLITAELAKSQGRKVYALPGKIGDSNSLGTNELIKSGATLVTRAGDIIDEYAFLYPHQLKSEMVYDYSPAKKAFDSYIKSRRKARKVGKPIENKTQIEEEIYKSLDEEGKSEIAETFEEMDISSLSSIEKQIYNALDFTNPMSPEQFTFNDVSYPQISAALTMLEIGGYISALPGNRFIKNHK